MMSVCIEFLTAVLSNIAKDLNKQMCWSKFPFRLEHLASQLENTSQECISCETFDNPKQGAHMVAHDAYKWGQIRSMLTMSHFLFVKVGI